MDNVFIRKNANSLVISRNKQEESDFILFLGLRYISQVITFHKDTENHGLFVRIWKGNYFLSLLLRRMNIHKGPVISIIGQFSSISTSSQLAKILGHLPES